MKKIVSLIFIIALSTTSLFAAADDIVGVWQTAGESPAKVQITKQGNKYVGKIIWFKNHNVAGKPQTDIHNPDESKRNNPIVGLAILHSFVFNANENCWENGKIYDPKNGKTYSCIVKIKDGKLNVRGYIGFSLIGRTEVWTKAA